MKPSEWHNGCAWSGKFMDDEQLLLMVTLLYGT